MTVTFQGLAVMMPPKGKLHGVFGSPGCWLLMWWPCVTASNFGGTAPYMAPEMLRNEGYDFLADVWSIGPTAEFAHFPVTWSRFMTFLILCNGRFSSLSIGLWEFSIFSWRGAN